MQFIGHKIEGKPSLDDLLFLLVRGVGNLSLNEEIKLSNGKTLFLRS